MDSTLGMDEFSTAGGPPSRRSRTVQHFLIFAIAAILAAPAAAAPAPQAPATPPPTGAATPPVTVPAGPDAAAALQANISDNSPDALTLDQSVDYAIRNNPRIAGAAAQVRAARAVITQRRAVRRPQANVTAAAGLQGPEVGAVVPGGNPIVPFYQWSLGAGVSQVILDFGQRLNRQREAEREAEAARFTQAETQNNVHFVVASAFYNVLRGRELQNVAEQNRAAAAEHLRVSQARFASDVAPRFDVLRSEAELADAEQQLTTARNQTLQAEAAYNTALGRTAVTPVRIRYEATLRLPDVPFERARDAAYANRPQLVALQRTIEAGNYEVRARRAENKPQVIGTAGYSRFNPTGNTGLEDRYSLGVALSFPFFDSGLTRGRVREAQANVDTDRANLNGARLQAELDIRQAQVDITTALDRLRSANVEVASAAEALRVAQVRYSAGVGTNVEVTDAQEALARAGENLANAQFDYETALERLAFATGTSIASLQAGPLTPRTSAIATPASAPARNRR